MTDPALAGWARTCNRMWVDSPRFTWWRWRRAAARATGALAERIKRRCADESGRCERCRQAVPSTVLVYGRDASIRVAYFCEACATQAPPGCMAVAVFTRRRMPDR